MKNKKTIILTFDVEDWFQVENLRPWFPLSSWDKLELRVERNTHHILDLLDSVHLDHCNYRSESVSQPKPIATFFLLGWIVERLPNLVREIEKRGHEVASHGISHQLCYNQSEKELKEELVKSKRLIEDIIGKSILGYRAPSFSISNHILKIIQSSGYKYDSSYNNFDKHGRYGHIKTTDFKEIGNIYQVDDNFFEIPLSNLNIWGQILPWAGGGYFRILPFNLFKMGVKHIIKKKDSYVFYAHPWEFDPGQPVVKEASFISRFKHYNGLSKTSNRLKNMLKFFSNCRFLSCQMYLQEIWGKNE